MERLKLTFLEVSEGTPVIKVNLDPVEEILDSIGKEIAEYAKGYFNYIVTTSSVYDNHIPALVINEASLYIIVPELGYDYNIFNLSYNNTRTEVILNFYTLITDQIEPVNFSISDDQEWDDKVTDRIVKILNSGLANETFKFIVNRIKIKREANNEEES